MYIKNYIAITIFSIYVSFMILILSKNFLISGIIGILTFFIISRLKRKQIKHDIEIETNYKIETLNKNKDKLFK